MVPGRIRPASPSKQAIPRRPLRQKRRGKLAPAKPVEKDFKPIPLAIDDNTPPKKKGNKDATKGEKKADAKKDVKPKAEQITWAEQRKWRDGSATTLQGNGAFAYYLTRKIVSTNPRTATVQIDGPVGFKMWLNGELVKASSPPPTVGTPLQPREETSSWRGRRRAAPAGSLHLRHVVGSREKPDGAKVPHWPSAGRERDRPEGCLRWSVRGAVG